MSAFFDKIKAFFKALGDFLRSKTFDKIVAFILLFAWLVAVFACTIPYASAGQWFLFYCSLVLAGFSIPVASCLFKFLNDK